MMPFEVSSVRWTSNFITQFSLMTQILSEAEGPQTEAF